MIYKDNFFLKFATIISFQLQIEIQCIYIYTFFSDKKYPIFKTPCPSNVYKVSADRLTSVSWTEPTPEGATSVESTYKTGMKFTCTHHSNPPWKPSSNIDWRGLGSHNLCGIFQPQFSHVLNCQKTRGLLSVNKQNEKSENIAVNEKDGGKIQNGGWKSKGGLFLTVCE